MIQVHIANISQLRAAFNASPQIVGRHLSNAIKKSTLLVEGASKIRTPVRTGFLRNSHVTRFEGGGFSFKGIVEPTAQYAPFVHEGTRFVRGRPFLRQGAESVTGQIGNVFEKAMQDSLNDIGRRV